MIARLARRAIASFFATLAKRREAKAAARIDRRLRVANPEIVILREKLAQESRRHRKVEPLRAQLQNLVNAQLAKEQGRSLPERIAR